MKNLTKAVLVLMAMAVAPALMFGQLIVQDDFSYPEGTDLSANGWSRSGTSWNGATVVAPGLNYQGYIGSGAGNGVSLEDYTDRYYKSMAIPASGNIYAAFMIRVDTATLSGGYVASFFSNNASRGRFWFKQDSSGNLRFGLSGKSASNLPVYDATNYSFGTTYLVVLKYIIVAGTTNDQYALIVNPVPGQAEPAPVVGPNTDTGSDLGANTAGSSFSIQGRDSLGTGGRFVLDGIRVSQSWSVVMPPPPYYYTGSGALDDVNNWGTNTNGSGTRPQDFAADNQLYLLTNTASTTLSTPWAIYGAGSKLIVGGGTAFTIDAGGLLIGTLDVASGASLTLKHGDWPLFGSVAGNVYLDNPAGISLSENKELPASSGTYQLLNGNLNLAGYTLTVKGRIRCNANIVTGNGTFILDSAATISVCSPGGIAVTGAAGDIQTTTRTFSRYANYTYVGAANQVTGDAIPDTVANITVAMANRNLTTALSKSVFVTSNLTMTSGKYVLGNYNLVFNNPAGQSDSSYVITDAAGALVRVVANANVKTMPVGSALEYRPAKFTFEAPPAAARYIKFRYVTGDTGSVGFPSNIYYRYKEGYWHIANDSVVNPTYRLDILSPNGFGEPTTRRLIYRANNTAPWDTVGTIPTTSGDTVIQAGVNVFGEFAVGVGAPLPPTTGKRYESEVFTSYQIQSGIVVGPDSKQTIDLYTGTGDTYVDRPLVIFIPGGGFKAVNAPGQFSNILGGGLAKRGYVVANVNYYRTTSNQPTDSVSFEAMLKAQQDVKAVIRFLRKNGTAYGIDTSQIFLTGSSAGSITALHIAYLDSTEIPANAVNWANLGGTFEGADRGTPGVSTRVSGVIANWGAIGDTAWMKNNRVPVYCVHGDSDKTVFFDAIPSDGPFAYSSKYISLEAQRMGVSNGLLVFPNTGHTLDNDAAKQYDAYVASAAWLLTLLKPSTVDVEEGASALPTEYMLQQNYPNPFNPSTTIRYELPAKSKVTLTVFNMLGQQLATLVNREETAGRYAVAFDAARFASGMYFYQLRTDSYVQTKKMLLLK